MPLRTLIVDDEQLAREELRYLLSHEAGVEICGEGTNGIEAVQLVREIEPDLVFMDVQMPGLDGFAVLKKLISRTDKKDPDKKDRRLPQIVFATAFDQYAVRAFEVNAVDYLLKPFDKKRVHQAVEKAQQIQQGRAVHDSAEANGIAAAAEAPAGFGGENLEQNLGALLRLLESRTTAKHPGRVALRAAGRLVLVDQKDICFASIDEGAITVVTPLVEGQANHRTLDELLETLDPGVFWRTHRSFVVNINQIREVVPWFKSSYQLRMDDPKKTEIPVSRNQTKRLRELFNL
jgi:two-component system LytT family response regulator/two-component system response regulator LytT